MFLPQLSKRIFSVVLSLIGGVPGRTKYVFHLLNKIYKMCSRYSDVLIRAKKIFYSVIKSGFSKNCEISQAKGRSDQRIFRKVETKYFGMQPIVF